MVFLIIFYVSVHEPQRYANQVETAKLGEITKLSHQFILHNMTAPDAA